MALNDGYDERFDDSKITPEEDARIKEAMKPFTDYDTAVKEYGDAVEVTGASGGSPSFKVNVPKARANRARRKSGSSSSGSGEVWVDTYVRSDGAVVHGHWRRRKNR